MFDTHHRVCANDFYTMFFTKKKVDKSDIAALFFLEKDTGRAIHIAGRLYDNFYLNMSSIEQGRQAHIRKRNELELMYPLYDIELRALDVESWIKSGGSK